MKAARGFVLLPVIVTLALLAIAAYLLNRDAGMNAALGARAFEADSVRYIAEAGLAQANYRAQNKNCTGYGALNDVAFGGGKFSATINPAAGSPVTINATARLADGASARLARSGVVVRQTSSYALALQPGAAGVDAYIDAAQPTFNYGADGSIRLQGGGVNNGLLRFDLASVPAGALVQSATLSLYASSLSAGGGDTLTLYPLTRAWSEGTGTGSASGDGATWASSDGTNAWSAPGGDYDAAAGASAPLAAAPGWISVDVTALVSDWVNGQAPNYGLLLVASAGVANAVISSSDNATAAQRPKLELTIYPPCGWQPQTTLSLGASADAYLSGFAPFSNFGGSGAIPIDEGGYHRGVFEFNTSSISAGTPLANATLRLYVGEITARSGGQMNLEAHALNTGWSENKVNWFQRTSSFRGWWSMPGGDYQAAAAATLSLPASFDSGWVEFDITALAQAWVDGVVTNNGVIVLETSPDQFSIASREADPAFAPQLVLTY